MLIFIFLAALINFSSTAPLPDHIDSFDAPLSIPLVIFSRAIPIPECVYPERYRTIQGIIWSCVATIFACTWISMHPNVRDPHKSGWANFRWRVMAFFYALIGPEFITVWALRQRLAAARHMEEYNVKYNLNLPKSSTNWKRVQGWFSEKWKFSKDWFCTPKSKKQNQRWPWTLTHGFLLEMHGLVIVDQYGTPFNHKPLNQILNKILPYKLSRAALIDYYSNIRTGVVFEISQLPDSFHISQEEINDKSKGDFLTKLIVVIQTTWFIVQCLARWAFRLHVTELEVVTLAFAFLNIATCFLWWNKPQNMHVAIPVCIERETEHKEVVDEDEERGPIKSISFLVRFGRFLRPDLSPWGGDSWLDYIAWLFNILKSPLDPMVIMLGEIVSSSVLLTNKAACVMFFSSEKGIEQPKIATAMVLIGTLFGSLHLIPFWVSSFPSVKERQFWVACAAWITVEPVFLLFAQRILADSFADWVDKHSNVIMKILFFIFVFPILLISGSLGFLLYAIARGILIYLAFAGLRSLPPDAFQNISWSTFFPHI